MKITSWNLNGIRSAYQKGLANWMSTDRSDIYCFQEIKAKEQHIDEELLLLNGYEKYINSAERPGYSGTAIFSKIPFDQIAFGIGVEEFDIEGRIISVATDNFTLFNVYFPNGRRDKARVPYKLRFYKKLLKICKDLFLEGKAMIITGDFNTAHNELDLKNPKSNKNNTGFLPEERKWIDNYLENGFKDIYREMYPKKNEYTWWSYRNNARERNIGWRLDYFLISDNLCNDVSDVNIQTNIKGSDHCPVSLLLK